MYEKKTTTYLYDMHDVLSAKKELVAGKIPVCVSDFPQSQCLFQQTSQLSLVRLNTTLLLNMCHASSDRLFA